MKKLFIGKFIKEMTPIARYRDMLDGYELVSAIPVKGFGWENKDVCILDGGVPTGFLLGTSERCGTVNFDAEFANETVICLDSSNVPTVKNRELRKLPVPIVMVMGQGENCQKFELQLALRKAFLREGYKVSQFGTKAYSKLFGFNPLPVPPDVSMWKKIYLYNDLFYQTCIQENPDVMIIGAPGGVMPINTYEDGLFGETALALATAAKPDVAVLSCYFVEASNEYFDLQRQYARFRLGADEIIFHSSNTKFVEDLYRKELGYLTLDSSFVMNKLNAFAYDDNVNLFNVFVPDLCERACHGIIEKLQSNIELL